jgi:hypothetical protein
VFFFIKNYIEKKVNPHKTKTPPISGRYAFADGVVFGVKDFGRLSCEPFIPNQVKSSQCLSPPKEAIHLPDF